MEKKNNKIIEITEENKELEEEINRIKKKYKIEKKTSTPLLAFF
jgi:hypothetical protein